MSPEQISQFKTEVDGHTGVFMLLTAMDLMSGQPPARLKVVAKSVTRYVETMAGVPDEIKIFAAFLAGYRLGSTEDNADPVAVEFFRQLETVKARFQEQGLNQATAGLAANPIRTYQGYQSAREG